MSLGPVSKLNKIKMGTAKISGDDAMSETCDVIVIFSIYDQCGAIQKLHSRCMVWKIYIFINSNL